MAQTTQQWFSKLKKWVPSWYFENRYNKSVAVTEAVFFAAAAIFQRAEQDMEDQQSATFILKSPGPIIDLLGDERDVPRFIGELDPAYEVRVQNSLFRNVGEVSLQQLIDSQLQTGQAFLIENEQYEFFDDPDLTETPGIPYFDDDFTVWIDLTKWYNWWTVLIPAQIGADDLTIQANIIDIIERNKAYGTTYDVSYGIQTTFFESEDGSSWFEAEDGSGDFITEGL